MVYECPIEPESTIVLPEREIVSWRDLTMAYGESLTGLKQCNTKIESLNSKIKEVKE